MSTKWLSLLELRQLKSHPLNREVDEQNVQLLMSILKQQNITEIKPIIISSDGFIADGSHRREACLRLSMPAKAYITKYKFDDIDIVSMQKNLKWTLYHYCKSFEASGIKTYSVFLKFCYTLAKKYGWEMDTLSQKNRALNCVIKAMYELDHTRAPSKNNKDFIISNIRMEHAELVLDIINAVSKEDFFVFKTTPIAALSRLLMYHPTINMDQLIQSAKSHASKDFADKEMWLQQWITIYNRSSKGGHKIKYTGPNCIATRVKSNPLNLAEDDELKYSKDVVA